MLCFENAEEINRGFDLRPQIGLNQPALVARPQGS